MSASHTNEILGHPRGLYVLFLTELWERFSYYGMRALLILYLTKHFLFGDKEGGLIVGSYAALVYAMPVIGGMIADRYLGFKKAITFGAILLVCGHFGMAFEGPAAERVMHEGESIVQRDGIYTQIFYLSLALIIVGVGFLKANISSIVGQLYGVDDPRRDAGFTIFYMGINLGALVATLLCAYLGETYSWRYGFGLAGIGMLFGLATFLRGSRHLQGLGEPPDRSELGTPIIGSLSKEFAIYGIGIVVVAGIWQLMQRTGELGLLLSGFGTIVVAWIVWFSLSRCAPIERDRMLVMLVLMILSVFFWALFEQAGSSLTLFTDRNVDMGEVFTAGMFQSLNPFYIIVFAPVFAWIWVRLSQKGLEPSTPAKFGLGVLQVGLGFAVLVYGAAQAGPDGKVAVVWLALMYLLHTTGELCLSPVGLSMVTKLSVARVGGMMMGVWFLSSSFAAYAAGMIAGLMAITDQQGGQSSVESLVIYTSVFEKLALLAIVLGVIILLVSPMLHRRMHIQQ
ncbi:MAG TPA: MFS transporter [Gammaproteobacteria bacterium]|nr:MFS transporter [Gammaproteobacteria bacterium]|tara:strand:+ start:918 stop:2450 length:1533 start_codon:yes stop_codon:yes gene_type:complete